MNHEMLKVRLAYIEQAIATNEHQLAQLNANLNVLIGGRQEVLHWLSQFPEQNPEDSLSLDDIKQMTGADSVEIIDKE